MKQVYKIAGCALGGAIIGVYANKLNTVFGGMAFSIGIVLLVVSIMLIVRNDNM